MDSRNIGSNIQAKTSSAWRWRTSPRAPYKVYEGDERKGTYATRAEARRAQQRLAEAEPQRNFVIKDVEGDVVS